MRQYAKTSTLNYNAEAAHKSMIRATRKPPINPFHKTYQALTRMGKLPLVTKILKTRPLTYKEWRESKLKVA